MLLAYQTTISSGPAKTSELLPKHKRVSIVPLLVGKKRLYVWATFDKQKYKCVVDTGGYRCLWPQRLGLAHTSEMFKASITDAGGKSLPGTGRILKQVQIGTYYFKELPSFAHTSHSKADLLSMPVLGNEAFEETVLTLDCRQKRMEIQQSGPALSDSPLAHGAILLKFTKLPTRDRVYPCVEAMVERKPIHLLLDTGWTHDDIGITPRLYSQLLPAMRAKRVQSVRKNMGFLTGRATTHGFKKVEWALGKTRATASAFVVPSLQPGVDAVCGISLFRNNRVTIDYTHGEVLLEPFAQADEK